MYIQTGYIFIVHLKLGQKFVFDLAYDTNTKVTTTQTLQEHKKIKNFLMLERL